MPGVKVVAEYSGGVAKEMANMWRPGWRRRGCMEAETVEEARRRRRRRRGRCSGDGGGVAAHLCVHERNVSCNQFGLQ